MITRSRMFMAVLAPLVLALGPMGCGGDDDPVPPEPNNWTFTTVHGAGANDVIALGFDTDDDEPLVFRQLGGTLGLEVLDVSDLVHEFREMFGGSLDPEFKLWAMDGPAGNMVAAGDHGVIYSFDGASWDVIYDDFRVANWRGVWVGDGEFYAVGLLGVILHGDSGGFTVENEPVPGSAPNLLGVWGSAANNVWAVGDVVLRFDGARWQVADNPHNGHWAAIDGRDQGDVWMGGESGYIMFFNGLTWEDSFRHAEGDIVAIDCLPGGEVVALAVHPGGTDILIHQADAWRVDATIAGVALDAVWGAAVDDIYAVGDGDRVGLLYHGDSTGWNRVDVDPWSMAAGKASRPTSP